MSTRGEHIGLGSRWHKIAVGGTAAGTIIALAGRESAAETGVLVGLVLGALVLAIAVAVVTARVVVPLIVRCCRGVTRCYRRIRPDSDVGRLMALSLAVFAAVGSLYLGVASLAL